MNVIGQGYGASHEARTDEWRSNGGMMLAVENGRVLTKACLSAALSTTNSTWSDPGANPGLCNEKASD
jgi:hypothetical protein